MAHLSGSFLSRTWRKNVFYSHQTFYQNKLNNFLFTIYVFEFSQSTCIYFAHIRRQSLSLKLQHSKMPVADHICVKIFNFIPITEMLNLFLSLFHVFEADLHFDLSNRSRSIFALYISRRTKYVSYTNFDFIPHCWLFRYYILLIQ